MTPSHNPPQDGGFKYNPPNGGPADTDVTRAVQDRANELLREDNAGVRRLTLESALRSGRIVEQDLIGPYVEDLANVVDLRAIRAAGLALAVDPLGGASVGYWAPINERYGLDVDGRESARRPDLRLHDASTTTARSGWIARARTRWRGSCR